MLCMEEWTKDPSTSVFNLVRHYWTQCCDSLQGRCHDILTVRVLIILKPGFCRKIALLNKTLKHMNLGPWSCEVATLLLHHWAALLALNNTPLKKSPIVK